MKANKNTYIAEQIKERVGMADAARFYGVTFNRAGFALCPFHNEKTASFRIHDNRGYCFGCGWSDDVLRFVMDMFGLSFSAALTKLNTDFSLGLPLDRRLTLREQRDAERRHREIIAERERQAAALQAQKELYWALWDEWIRLDQNRMKYAPAGPEEALHPLFLEALQKISHQEYLIDTLPWPHDGSVVK